MDQQPKPLTDRIAAAFERLDAQQWGYDHGFCGTFGTDPETDSFVNAALAVVQPELDRLRAELEQAQQQTATRIATEIRQYCPDHGEADTCRIDCHCEIADEITRLYTAPAAVSGA